MMIEEPLQDLLGNAANNECGRVPKIKTPMDERIFDMDGYWLRASAICLRENKEHNLCRDDNVSAAKNMSREVLLVTSTAHPDRWIVPGGKLQLGEMPEMSAAREAMEEAGVVGILGRCVGIFANSERKHRTHVFELHVTNLESEYEDKERRRRQWFNFNEALTILSKDKPSHADYLHQLIKCYQSECQISS